ncbi:MAG: hypothetical protein F6K50_06575 [Moorea sp. SIO3I7]|uniref:hypothetical protein n=1 Tax=Moorena TaxID=1155738 RepID=UPI000AF635DF|nr:MULTISPECIES: hypothetical protein [Moorena]NEN95205.1 hypothetical protein [Moorena sp. SIO3I7]NEO05474.1 hypothetical protein [Moorena sp. SIO3I8]NEO22829.1 hypothetical protein [Moorena sp. SIO4A5]NEP25972.1 hypothetical protein [Moorena sp. SIO3I6]NEQ60723.1 hypothetical protein [Moorena sp. SIO4A1]
MRSHQPLNLVIEPLNLVNESLNLVNESLNLISHLCKVIYSLSHPDQVYLIFLLLFPVTCCLLPTPCSLLPVPSPQSYAQFHSSRTLFPLSDLD